jgi:dTMP kinase
MLFAADRNEHVFGEDGVAERCKRGELVVSDRYLLSSLVYQGITCGEELPARLNREFPAPELLLFFDIDCETALKRMEGRAKKEIYEYKDFQIQVRERYKALLPRLSAEGVKVGIIDASLPAEEVALEVWSAIKKMPIFER